MLLKHFAAALSAVSLLSFAAVACSERAGEQNVQQAATTTPEPPIEASALPDDAHETGSAPIVPEAAAAQGALRAAAGGTARRAVALLLASNDARIRELARAGVCQARTRSPIEWMRRYLQRNLPHATILGESGHATGRGGDLLR